MDGWLVAAWFQFFILPAVSIVIGVTLLEDRDSTGSVGWRGGATDPCKQIAYNEDGRIRPSFRPVVYVVTAIYLVAVVLVSLWRL